MPSTVDVPPSLEAAFAAAEELVGLHFEKKRERPDQGTIDIDGERYVLVRAASLSERFFGVVREIYGEGREAEADEFARNILFDLAHAIGRSDAEKLAEKIGDDAVGRLSAGPVHFAHTGWARVKIFEASRPTPDDDFYMIYDHPYSFESDAWLRSDRTPGFPACIMNSGYSSGWCEASFGVHLVAAEVLCRACGDEVCRFIMAPPHRIEEHLERWARPDGEPPTRRPRAWQVPDLFARKTLEERLRRAHDELEDRVKERTAQLEQAMRAREDIEQQLRQSQKMEAIGRLSGGIAHDFNNVLGVILGCTSLLERRYPADESVKLIEQAASRAAELTAQLLAFSRSQIVRPEPVELNEVVDEVCKLAGPLLGEHITLTVQRSDAPLHVSASAGALQQVLLNLCLNARDAMPDGGALTLEVSTDGDTHVLSVEDTGVGMDASTVEKIFDPFFSTKDREEGTGLGLSTAHGIVHQLGGGVVVDTAPGEGARFTVSLPAVAAPTETDGSDHPLVPTHVRATVLVVEDDELLRGVVKDILDEGGHRVIVHANGQQALTWIDDGGAPFDLLLTDVVMPGISGRILADAILSRRPGVKILYMSGYADDDGLRRGLLGPGASCLHKPFTSDELLGAVQALLASSEPTE